MLLPTIRQARIIALLGAVQLAFPASAQTIEPVAATGMMSGEASTVAMRSHGQAGALVSSELLAALQSIASQNQCVSYSYDRNGNITSKVDQTFGASPTWGSSAFGCFTWTSP